MSKSKKWRNGKKKRISSEEKAKRDALKQKRLERQKRESITAKKEFLITAIPVILLGILFVGFIIIDIIFDTGVWFSYCSVLIFAIIFLFDKSGFRSFIFRKLPDKIPFSEMLKNNERKNRRGVEICKTISFLSVWSILFIGYFSFLPTAFWILSTFIVFIYVIFDINTKLSKGKDDLTASGGVIIFAPIALYIISYQNVAFDLKILYFSAFFTIAVTISYFIAYRFHHKEQFIIRELILLLVGAVVFSFVAFTRVNRDFDFSEPIQHNLIVEDMYYHSGRNSYYSIYVDDWNNENEMLQIEISSDAYHTLNIGDEVIILEFNGALGMEHYAYYGKAD